MQTACVGEHLPAARIRMLPIIDLSPTDESCIFSTLLFVEKQAAQLQVKVPCITFDQALFIKAVDIVRACGLKVVVRLGGFHTLMSFLGAVGSVMLCSGLEEMFQLNYGPTTVDHMLTGQAVSRALRCHFLINSALTSLLLTELLQPSSVQPGADSHNGENSEIERCDETDESNIVAEGITALSSAEISSIMNLCDSVEKYNFSVEKSSELNFDTLDKLQDRLLHLQSSLAARSRTAKLHEVY